MLRADGVTRGRATRGAQTEGRRLGRREPARHRRELVDLLSIPNVAADRENIRKNAELLREHAREARFHGGDARDRGNPLVYGELKAPGATRTLLFYAHYDGQPVNPKDWKQPSPFTPILRDRRMEDGGAELGNSRRCRRSTPTSASTRVPRRTTSRRSSRCWPPFDALKANNQQPTSNVRVILDGEEEAGSPSLVPAIAHYRDKLPRT